MAAGRTESSGNEKAPTPASTLVDSQDPTLHADAWAGEVRGIVEMHRAIAMRLLKEGSASRAFTELVRASRAVPMTARLATSLAYVGQKSGSLGPAVTLLSQGIDEAEGAERLAVMRVLARLLRRTGDQERCMEYLVQILAEQPADRRSRFVLDVLLERAERWDELDASLDKQTREELRRGAMRAASRTALKRARLWGERLDDPAHAALRYGQAAHYAEEGGDLEAGFLLRLLWVRSLHQSHAPARQMDDAVKVSLEAGQKVGKADRVRALARELGLTPGVASPSSSRSTSTPAVGLVAAQQKPTLETNRDLPMVADPASVPMPRRHSTQLELIAVAEEAEKAGNQPEVAAILAAAVAEGPDPQAAQKLESHYIQRGSWRELAQFYRDTAAKASAPKEKALAFEKLAELLESELRDPLGAAKAWAEVVAATGDSRAVAEQVRLLAQQKDAKGVRGALDLGVEKATESGDRARALVLRAEEALTRREVASARADFEAALKLVPKHPFASAGLAELASMQGDYAPARALDQALATMPKRAVGRGDLYRRLARLADNPLRDTKLARLAWNEVLSEFPADEEATARVMTLARAAGDDALLEQLLRALLGREPRGPRARIARMDLVALLERVGRVDEALNALRDAARIEPGHQEAWSTLAERLITRKQDGEAAWALEHAATATADKVTRLKLWERLSRFSRERLHDEDRAQTYDARAEKLKRELIEELPRGPVGIPLMIPQRRAAPAAPLEPLEHDDLEEIADALESRLDDTPATPVDVPPARARPPAAAPFDLPETPPRNKADDTRELPPPEQEEDPEPGPLPASERTHIIGVDDVVEVITGDLEVPEDELAAAAGDEEESEEEAEAPADAGRSDVTPAESEEPDAGEELMAPGDEEAPRRETQELKMDAPALGDPSVPLASSFGPSPSKALGRERQALFERVRSSPLDPEGYRLLAEHFDNANDSTRSSLMLEIARALEGDPHAAPRTPRLILSATDRAGLRHPALRGEPGELMSLVGVALCRLHPTRGRDAGSREEFRLDSGRGARLAADALLAAVRILGLRAPDVYLTDDGPPFSLVYAMEPRLLVSRLAVKKELNDAELRFFAGRALFTQNPELLALRSLRRDQVQHGLQAVAQALGSQVTSADARVVRDALPQRAFERLRTLFPKVARRVDLALLSEGARHSANRAGLVVCGGIAPAVAALRAKKALPAEMIELVRFAASERYLQMRGRKLAPPKKTR